MPTLTRKAAKTRFDRLDAKPYTRLSADQQAEYRALAARLASGGSEARAAAPGRPLSEYERLQIRIAAAKARKRQIEDDDAMRGVRPRKNAKTKAKAKKKKVVKPDPSASPSVGTGPQVYLPRSNGLTDSEASLLAELRKRGKKNKKKGKGKNKPLYGVKAFGTSDVKPAQKHTAPVAFDTRYVQMSSDVAIDNRTGQIYTWDDVTRRRSLQVSENEYLNQNLSRLLANDPELMDEVYRRKAKAYVYAANIVKPGKGKKGGKKKGKKVSPFKPKSAGKGPLIPSNVGVLPVKVVK